MQQAEFRGGFGLGGGGGGGEGDSRKKKPTGVLEDAIRCDVMRGGGGSSANVGVFLPE